MRDRGVQLRRDEDSSGGGMRVLHQEDDYTLRCIGRWERTAECRKYTEPYLGPNTNASGLIGTIVENSIFRQ